MYKSNFLFLMLFMCSLNALSQSLPSEYRMMPDLHQIKIGGDTESGLYKQDEIKTIYLDFTQSNWWNLLTANYSSGTEIPATMTVDGVVYDQVGVAFKGQTSYSQVNGQKKSFSIKTDAFVDGQTCQGYKTFNLNNCFSDPTFLREFMYLHMICKHIPAAKVAFVRLVINGESWGLYPSVQQMNGDYLSEWFETNNGTLWRADAPVSNPGGPGGPGGGPSWGDGTAALNYLGPDTADYQDYYTLKSTSSPNPWDNLVEICDVLNNTPIANLETTLPGYMDIDRTLWFLACEIAFGDDDSYVFKGKMDYYTYWEIETGRMVPLEYDGNSVLVTESQNWGPFYHANDVDYPLMNKLMQVPAFRQRYLAHLRTIISELLDATTISDFIDYYSAFIDAEVQSDTKKLYTYSQFTTGLVDLENMVTTRRNTLNNNFEVNTTGALISNTRMISPQGLWIDPLAGEVVNITTQVSTPDGIFAMNLYYSDQVVGNFAKLAMYDDGNHNDGAAGDLIFGASIPGMAGGVLVRYYIESVENNVAKTRSYDPAGAEHDVYYYLVAPIWAPSTDVVINEVMASNQNTMSDEWAEFDDWIELYNRGNSMLDLTGWHLTDNSQNLDKWPLPAGTLIAPNAYVIIWADEDALQGPMHCNFKLSAAGEVLTLLNADGMIADRIEFGIQQTDMGYARNPNGFGEFVIQDPTFFASNSPLYVEESNDIGMVLFPNPANDRMNIRFVKLQDLSTLSIYDLQGKLVLQQSIPAGTALISVNTTQLDAGIYQVTNTTDHSVLNQRLIITH